MAIKGVGVLSLSLSLSLFLYVWARVQEGDKRSYLEEGMKILNRYVSPEEVGTSANYIKEILDLSVHKPEGIG
jgi:hypothetical protein